MTPHAKKLSLSISCVVLTLIAASCTMPSITETASPEPSQAEPTHPEAGAPGTGPDSIRPPGAPTVAPEFPYSGHGETLAMIQYVSEGSHRIILLDPFGLGLREFRLPEGIEPPNVMTSGLSPDGKYFVYYTGSTETGDLALVAYDLNAETSGIEIPLLSSDYPANFQELADSFIASGNIPQDLSWVEPENMATELQYAFEFGIETFAWSPQGRYLAFSGQMEGPSSDLYLLDIQTMEITRLTSGTGMMERIGWSPDGHWIRHTSFYFVGAGYQVTNHVASRDGSQVISFPAHEGLEWGPWLTTNLFLANEGANGPGTYNLKVMDASHGSVTTIFDGAFGAYTLNPFTNTILLQSYPFFDDDPELGLYLVEANEPYSITQITSPGEYYVDYIGLDGYPFIGYPDEGGTILIGGDGSFKPLLDQAWQATAAPTANLLALFNSRDEDGLWIYDLDQDQRTEVTSRAVQWVEWRPDSGAIFYRSGHELHVYTLETGEHMLIYAWPGSPVNNTYFSWVILP